MCTASCSTGNHRSWGECLRAKNVKVAYCQSSANRDYTQQRKWDRELGAYEAARKEGIQPQGTRRHLIDAAMRISDTDGAAYDAGVP
jgi:hypothetical protein